MHKLFLLSLGLILSVNSIDAQTFRLIIAADVVSSSKGMENIANEKSIADLCSIASESLNYKLETTYLEKTDFSSSILISTLKSLKCRKKDIVFFYYAGEKFTPNKNNLNSPYLKLNDWAENPISFDEVSAIINSLKDIYGFAVADFGNTTVKSNDLSGAFFELHPVENWMNTVFIQKLFLGNCGLVKATSLSNAGMETLNPFHNEVFGFTSAINNYFRSYLGLFGLVEMANISMKSIMKFEISSFEVLPCRKDQEALVKKFPSYENTLGSNVMDNIFHNLIIRNKEEQMPERKKIVNWLQLGFTENAMIRLKRFHEGQGTPYFNKSVIALNYFKEFVTPRPNLIAVEPISSSIIRTTDFAKITTMEIQEMWK